MTFSRQVRIWGMVGLVLLIILASQQIFSGGNNIPLMSSSEEEQLLNKYEEWPMFSAKTKYSTEWYRKNCFGGNFTKDVESIFSSHISKWSKSDVEGCKEIYKQFDLLYEVHHRFSAKLIFPPLQSHRVEQWLKGGAATLKDVHHQNLIHVYHPLTAEHVVYNPIRALRPFPSSSINLHEWVNKQAATTAKNCEFCNASTMTAADEFGRHITRYTVRISNTFKVERWHCLVATRFQHHPLNFTLNTFIAFFDDAWKYMLEIGAKENAYIYPNICWDSLYQAGVSVLHPHIHIMVAPDHYYGFFELMRSAGQRYYKAAGKNYFSTLLEIHEVLGLTIRYGDSVAFPTLVGKSDMEVMFISENPPGEDFYRLIFYVIKAYHDTYTQLCKGFAGAYPAMGPSRAAHLGRIPVVARLISRGDCTSPRVDYTSYEIFQIVYRNHDPWQVADAIRKAIKKHDK